MCLFVYKIDIIIDRDIDIGIFMCQRIRILTLHETRCDRKYPKSYNYYLFCF